MLDELLPYYENELTYLRRLSKEFASKYPKIASRLQMEGEVCEDPHVERMIESFAFLTSRIHKKLDDEFPQITEAMLSVLYPHFLRPVPSMFRGRSGGSSGHPPISERTAASQKAQTAASPNALANEVLTPRGPASGGRCGLLSRGRRPAISRTRRDCVFYAAPSSRQGRPKGTILLAASCPMSAWPRNSMPDLKHQYRTISSGV